MKAKIYIKPTCPFCIRAVALLKSKNIETEVFDVGSNTNLREEISASVGGHRTVPMIFIDGNFVGGCSELEVMDRDGRL